MCLTFDEKRFDNELIHYLKTHHYKFKSIKRTQTLLLCNIIYAYYDVLTPDNEKYRYQVSKTMNNKYNVITLI